MKDEVAKFFEKAACADLYFDFDDVWRFAGYSTKGNAKRALKGPGLDGEVVFADKYPVGTIERKMAQNSERLTETILLTPRGVRHFCMKAPGVRGMEIRDHFIGT